MAELRSDVEGRLLDRLDAFAELLGTDRSQLVERALQQYLAHGEALELAPPTRAAGPSATVDWAQAKQTLIESHCPFPSCPHHGNCPIDVCPL